MHRRCASFPKQKALHLQCNGADSRNTSTFCSQSAALLQKAVTFRVSLRENLPQAAFCSLAQNRTPLAHQRVAPRKTKKALYLQCFSFSGGATQNRTGGEGFADLCLTAWLWRRIIKQEITHRYLLFLLERITGLEPATSTLARWRSTK